MSRLFFYLSYAARNLRRGVRWATFAVFCIAAGVATVVALRSLGLAIGDSLTENVRVNNHGDITVTRSGSSSGMFPGMGRSSGTEDVFSLNQVQRVQDWAKENDAQVALYYRSGNLQVTAISYVSVGRPQFINVLFIDPQTFPPTGDILALDPAGVPLRSLFTGGDDIVISRNLADSQNIKVGDTVRVSNTTDLFTVRGIAATENEGSITNPLAAFFGFAYLDQSEAGKLQQPTEPNIISITLPPGTDIDAAEASLRSVLRVGNYSTVPDMLKRNQQISDVLGRFIVVMGLGALLIGGVGIINTMLVMVGRRTEEIAALKTFGLKGRQVGALFLAEAFLLGVLGSIVGCVLGVLLSAGVNQYGAAFLQQQLPWRVYPEALLYGISLGVVVTLVFGILPVLTANRIRPAIILRPNETHVPGVGLLHSLFALLLVVVVIGGIAGKIIGDIPIGNRGMLSGVIVGIIGVALTLLILGILVVLLWVVVWLVSHLPSFGSVDLRLALRNLTARRIRTATTLLALSAGMFALSSITFVGVGTREILQFQLSQNLGGNVMVFPIVGLVSQTLAQGMLTQQLSGVQGVENNTRLSTYNTRLVAVNGEPPVLADDIGLSPDAPNDTVRRAQFSVEVMVRDSTNPQASTNVIARGRDFTPEDRGRAVLLVMQDWAETEGVDVGSTLTLQTGGAQKDFEVIGLVQSSGTLSFGKLYAPPGSLGGSSDFQFNVLQVDPAHLNEVLLKLSENPLVLALDITFIDGLLKRMIDQFAAIPTVVGLLSLLAAAVAMANTVSLQTLERRRQIGVLKAVGLKGRRVLWIMLLENTLVGLLGGLIGIGVSALVVSLMTQLGIGDAIPIPREATGVAVALVVASVLIAWTATFLSARAAVGERVANVLRYE
jgi:predicted lysophospholipase L1 biosynthesis ABC-type transport system permease subunit